MSESYLLTNLNTGSSLSNKENQQREISSLIKIPLFTLTLQVMENKKHTVWHLLSVKDHHLSNGSGFITWSRQRMFNINKLFKFIIIYSDSTAYNVLIDYCGGPEKFKDYLEEQYPSTKLLLVYIHFNEETKPAVATSNSQEVSKMLIDLYKSLETKFFLKRRVASWSKSSHTWFSFHIKGYEALIVKTGSMYDLDSKNSYIMNLAAILHDKKQDKTCAIAYLSDGKLPDSGDISKIMLAGKQAEILQKMLKKL